MILLVDNRDSFVFNLAQELQRQGAEVLVRAASSLSLGEIAAAAPAGILLGPGPGGPADARLSLDVVRTLGSRIPILGVCLGHQVIAEVFGGRTVRSENPVHGRAVEIQHDGQGLLAGLPNPARLARYNSLTVDPKGLPLEIELTAHSMDGDLMGLRHNQWPLEGVQFHPESIESQGGEIVLANFIGEVRSRTQSGASR